MLIEFIQCEIIFLSLERKKTKDSFKLFEAKIYVDRLINFYTMRNYILSLLERKRLLQLHFLTRDNKLNIVYLYSMTQTLKSNEIRMTIMIKILEIIRLETNSIRVSILSQTSSKSMILLKMHPSSYVMWVKCARI
jgi:hypothetical protein